MEIEKRGRKLLSCFEEKKEDFLSELKSYLELVVEEIEGKDLPDKIVPDIIQLEKSIYAYGVEISEAVRDKSATKEAVLSLTESVNKYFSYTSSQ